MIGRRDRIKAAIQQTITVMMDRVLNNVLVRDPFIIETHHATKPLYAALVPDEIFKGSHFERRFVTPFGKAWQELAIVVARESLGRGEQEYTIQGNIRQGRLRRIQETLNSLEHAQGGMARTRPDWVRELEYVLEGDGDDIPTSVIVDVYTESIETGERHAFEIKAPLPNSDQTKVSKEKLLKLYAMDPPFVDAAYYALPYNPYGTRENYNWSFPARWFNMREDAVVLIGDEFWNTIGGEGTYQSFIEAINEIGPGYRERIYREFLGIEPPPEGGIQL